MHVMQQGTTVYDLCMNDGLMFGDWVRGHRKRLGWSQQRLATELGMDRAHVSKIESGAIALPEADTRARFHRLFSTEDADLERLGILPRYDQWGRVLPAPSPASASDPVNTANPFPPDDIRYRVVEELKAIDLDGPDGGFWRQHLTVELWLFRDMKAGLGDEIQATTELGEVAHRFGPEGTIEDDVNVG